MAKRRRTVPHLWNRLIAAVLFVLGAALSTAAPSESKETRVSKGEATQLEAAGRVARQLTADLAFRVDGGGDDDDGDGDTPASAPSVFTLAACSLSRAVPAPGHPAARIDRPARDGDSRAPPSA